MTRVVCIIVIASVATLALFTMVSARAGSGYELSWRLGAGSAFPLTPERFGDLHTAGLDVEVGVGARIPHGLLLIGTYDFTRFFVDEAAVTEFVQSEDPSHDPGDPVDSSPTVVHSVMVQAVVPLTSSLVARPYVIGGIGWMWLRSGDITYEDGKIEGDDESGFATALGLGVDFRVDRDLKAFVEAAWSLGFTGDKNTQYAALRLGICR
jgi:opacity protein-like surface antigen